MTSFDDWSHTPASNGTADSAVNYREGQSPSTVNNAGRSVMAQLAKWRDDLSGKIETGGADTAYTITSYRGVALADGVMIAARMHATNGAAPTLNVDSTGAKAIQKVSGTAVDAGVLLAGGIYLFTYRLSTTTWIVQGFTGEQLANLAALVELTAPASGDLVPIADVDAANAIKRITLANLLKVIASLTALTAPAADDIIALSDTDASAAAKAMTLANLLKVVNGLTEDASPDGAADFLLSYDTSASAAKKVKPGNLTVASAALATLAPGSLLGILEDRKAQGTNGGTFTLGAWRTRDLNAEVYDRSGILSISSNQFAISAPGDYEIEWSAPGWKTQGHQTRLYDVTGDAVLAYGEVANAHTASEGSTHSRGLARVTIAGATTFRIEHQCTVNANTSGFGQAANFGTEVYARVIIRKG